MSNRSVAILVPPEESAAPADRADTFVQARQISECLTILGNDCLTIIFDPDAARTEDEMRRVRPDAVVNLVEDLPEGPDQAFVVTALLDRLGIRYTGARTAALCALGDKRNAKRALAAAGLPVAPGLEGEPADARYIVKSAVEHASIGIDAQSVVAGRDAAEMLIARRKAERGGAWFAERYIDGREFNVGLLEIAGRPVCLPVAEILFLAHADRPKVVGYAEKWDEDSLAYASTPRTFSDRAEDAALRAELRRLALAAWEVFGLTGYARVDFRVDADGRPYILEVNANPCLAEDAGFCAGAHEAGMTQADVVGHLIEAALA